MKQKIKLYILQIEGWKVIGRTHTNLLFKEGYTSKEHVRWALNNPTKYHYLQEAWSSQFSTWKDYFKTKLFWLAFTTVLGALFALFSDHSTVISNGIHWFNYASGICFLFPLGWTIYGLFYMLFKFLQSKLK